MAPRVSLTRIAHSLLPTTQPITRSHVEAGTRQLDVMAMPPGGMGFGGGHGVGAGGSGAAACLRGGHGGGGESLASVLMGGVGGGDAAAVGAGAHHVVGGPEAFAEEVDDCEVESLPPRVSFCLALDVTHAFSHSSLYCARIRNLYSPSSPPAPVLPPCAHSQADADSGDDMHDKDAGMGDD